MGRRFIFFCFLSLTCCNFWQHLFGNCYYSDCYCTAPSLVHYAIVVMPHDSLLDGLPSFRRRAIDCHDSNWWEVKNSLANHMCIERLDWLDLLEWSSDLNVVNHRNCYCFGCQHRAFGCRCDFVFDLVLECCAILHASMSVWHPSVVMSTTWSYILASNWSNCSVWWCPIEMHFPIQSRLLVLVVQLTNVLDGRIAVQCFRVD